MRPLFIPLKTEFFNAFVGGHKSEELRVYGPRWNEKTCAFGRDVVLSKGYGKQARLKGSIRSFKKQHASTFGSCHKKAIKECFGTLDIDIAVITIEIYKPVYSED
jgi:hypothetical protein